MSSEVAPRGKRRMRLKRHGKTAKECVQQLFNNESLSDVTFLVGEESFPAHKVILAARSHVFEELFFGTKAEEDKPVPSEKEAETEAEAEETGDAEGAEPTETTRLLQRLPHGEGEQQGEVKDTQEATAAEAAVDGGAADVKEETAETVLEEGTGAAAGEAEVFVSPSVIHVADSSSESFLRFLQFLYTDEVDITDQHCVFLLYLAKKYGVPLLEDMCNEFFMKSVTEHSVCHLLASFSRADGPPGGSRHQSIVENLVEYVQQHAAQVLESENFTLLALEQVRTILDTTHLNGTELQVFNAVVRWSKSQCAALGLSPDNPEHVRDVAHDLLPLIRFASMDSKDIATTVLQSKILNTDEMVELFSYLVATEGQKELSFCSTEAREKRLITFLSGDGITLTCNNKFEGGVMQYLATKGNTQDYENPMLRGEVHVQATTWMTDADPIHFVVDRQVKRCVTRATAMQHITIEVKHWNVRPTAYLLRHYSSWDTEALRTWVFEAAAELDGEWTVLKRHKDDTHLKEKGAWHIWALDDVTAFYRFFRVTQLAQNSNNHDYLACSGFELWGTMIHV